MNSKPKQVWIRQMDAARQAQIAVIVEIMQELDYVRPEAQELDPSLVAECLIRNIDVQGAFRDLEEAHEAVQAATFSKSGSGEAKTTEEVEAEDFPTCPRCGGDMTVRVVKNGPRAGSSFYGCRSYPECKGTAPIEA